jgi:hypothetical protein
MLKDVARFIVLIMLFNMLPAPVWAQQPAPTHTSAPPQLNLFVWKALNESPLVPAKLLPEGYGTGDESKDWDVIQRIASEAQGYEEPSRLFWAAVNLVFFRGTGVHPQFKADLTERILAGRMTKETFAKGFVFYPCGMAWGTQGSDGSFRARFTGNPMVDFDEPLEVYMIDPVRIPSGPYYGMTLAPIIPVKCINLTCMEAAQVTEKLPSDPLPPPPPPPTMAEIKIKKDWKLVNGKKADTPSRDDLQLRFQITPQDGGETQTVEVWDNKEAKVLLEAGKTYNIREYLETDRWRATRDAVTFTVDEKRNEEVRFENIQVPAEPEPTTLAQAMCTDCKGEPGRDGRDGRDGKGMPKWMKIALPIIGGVAAAALFLPKGGEKIVVTEAQKGLNNPGFSPP